VITNFLLSVVASLVVASGFYFIELLKRPKVSILRETPTHVDDEGAPPNSPGTPRLREKTLRVVVTNRPSYLRVIRYPARGVHATIRFLTPSGSPECEDEMRGRWSGLPEPFIYLGGPHGEPPGDGRTPVVVSPGLFRQSEYIDLHTGGRELLDVAVRIDGEEPAYGWCNESFLNGHRHPKFKLGKGPHRVRVHVQWDSGSTSREFTLQNGEGQETFFLKPL
jgi:hypothetical protein